MKLKEVIGKQLAENCDSIAASRMIFELISDFDKYESEEDDLKRHLENLITIHNMRGEMEFALELKGILKKILDIDSAQDAIESQITRLVRQIKNENWLSNGLWRGVRKDEKKTLVEEIQ
ncbi:hypothetical protein [Mesoaciditoga lauensis]|uniref:hypothetical protein n=1 Tax=Mesoaciditoga lauensis TaxID=1495039 RepID=UPI0005641ACE|nr:hypothetical protein [Mesoaciditoga lauensis]